MTTASGLACSQGTWAEKPRPTAHATVRATGIAAAHAARYSAHRSESSRAVFGIGTRARTMYDTRSLPSRMSCMPRAARLRSRSVLPDGTSGSYAAIRSVQTTNDVHLSKRSASVRSVTNEFRHSPPGNLAEAKSLSRPARSRDRDGAG